MTGIVLHIGLSKTATTTLQRAVFQNHSQICYLGKIAGSRHGRQCASTDTYEFLAPLLWQTDQPCDIAAAKSFYAETLESRAGANQIILGSWEGLGQQGMASFEASLQRLVAVCGVCRILISLRNPVTRLPSMYLQHLRGNQKQLARTYVTFDDWLDSQEQQLGSLQGIFAYRDYVEMAVRLLGAANVGVFLFEEFESDPEQYLRDVSGFLGIDAEETIDLAEGQHLHTRLFESQVNKMQAINSSLAGRLAWRLSSVERKKKSIGFSDRDGVIQSTVADDSPASVNLAPETLQRISDASREGNNWLVNELHLELGKYGYALDSS